MLDFFLSRKGNFWTCRSFLPLFPIVLHCAKKILVSLKSGLLGLGSSTDHSLWLIIHSSVCCDKLSSTITSYDGVRVILGQYVLSVMATFLLIKKTCHCLCLFNHTHPPTSLPGLGTTLKSTGLS